VSLQKQATIKADMRRMQDRAYATYAENLRFALWPEFQPARRKGWIVSNTDFAAKTMLGFLLIAAIAAWHFWIGPMTDDSLHTYTCTVSAQWDYADLPSGPPADWSGVMNITQGTPCAPVPNGDQ